jgi:arabinose-5-phosphate isomerase
MLTGKKVPKVMKGEPMRYAIEEINRMQLGATLVVEKGNILVGIVTDGDIRRCLITEEHIHDLPVERVMTRNPKTLGPGSLASQALGIMEKHEITILPIVNPIRKVRGILHLHDILGKGAFKFNDV